MLKDKRKVAFPSTKPRVTYDKCEYFPFNLPCTYIVAWKTKESFILCQGSFRVLS